MTDDTLPVIENVPASETSVEISVAAPTKEASVLEPQPEILKASAEPVLEPPPTASQSAAAQMPTAASSIPSATSLRAQALEAKLAKVSARRDSIVALAHARKKITNNDVQLHCHISDATATRDLEHLVKDGRLKRMGKQKRPTYEPA